MRMVLKPSSWMRFATVPKSWVSAVGPCQRPSKSVLDVSNPNQFTPLRVIGPPSVPKNWPFDTDRGTYGSIADIVLILH